MTHTRPPTIFRHLGLRDYRETLVGMQTFTDERQPTTADEVWLLEHHPVFTVGLNGDMQHVLAAGDIPVMQVDRGGQVTYHGPGQLVVYPLIDLKRTGMGVRDLVNGLENSVIACLESFDVIAARRRDAPGVYVENRKIASLGLRIRRGCSYHGLALNIDMDLEPFSRINPCGFSDLQVISLQSLEVSTSVLKVAEVLGPLLQTELNL